MPDAWVLGAAATAFRKWPKRDFRSLVHEAVESCVADAGLEDGLAVDGVWFGNCAMHLWGQGNLRGQHALTPLVGERRLPGTVAIINVEAGCATGSLALHGAVTAVRAGAVDLALAVGVEKTLFPEDPARTLEVFAGGVEQRHPDEWRQFFTEQCERHGEVLSLSPERVMFLDVHALQARHHMKRFGTTVEQIAFGASKNHHHGSLNSSAQVRLRLSPEEILADRIVVAPLTRSMCAPISDGAAALLVCSDRFLASLAPEARGRALRVRGCALSGGRYRDLDAPALTRHAAARSFGQAGLSPASVGVVELHDATSFCEILHLEELGFVQQGDGGPFVASGATALGGELPVNLSGGLVSKGHPLGATGIGMVTELALQLRGEAGDRQAIRDGRPPAIGLAHNAGGLIGWDEAVCAVTILERVV